MSEFENKLLKVLNGIHSDISFIGLILLIIALTYVFRGC